MKNSNELLAKKLKKEAIECVQTLSTHGLPNLSRTKYKFIKFMWSCLTILSAGLSIYFIVKTLSEYADFNVTTEVKLIYSDNQPIEFPSVSICNYNQFSTDFSLQLIDELIKTKFNYSFNEIFDPNFPNQNLTFMAKYYLKHNESKYLFQNVNMSKREEYTLSIRDSLKYCRFANSICNYTDFDWFFNSKYGNCYKFNGKGLKTINKNNQENGLFIELLLRHPQKIDALGFGKGLYLSIDSSNLDTYSDFENLIEISAGVQTSIKLEKSLFQKYPRPYSNCDFYNDLSINDDSSLNSQQQELYQQIKQANFSYSHSFCVVFCRHKMMSQLFECKFKANSLQVPNVNYCPSSSNANNSIIENETSNFNNITNTCSKLCPRECETIKYDMDIYINKFTKMDIDYVKYHNNLTNDSVDIENLVILKIFYGSMSYMSYKEWPSMSVFGLISNLGGILGLFLGITCIFLFNYKII